MVEVDGGGGEQAVRGGRARRLMKVLFLGELTPTAEHLARLKSMRIEPSFLGANAAYREVEDELARTDFVFANNVDLDPLLPALRSVRLTVIAATGYHWLDIHSAREFGVRIANLPLYSAPAVLEYMLWAALDAARPLQRAAHAARGGDWSTQAQVGGELAGSRTGILGYGRIGSALAARLDALGARVVVGTRRPEQPVGKWSRLPLPQLLEASEFLFVCCSLTEDSTGLLDDVALASLPSDANLVSTSPSAVFDLEAVARAFDARPLARAILDLDRISPEHPLFSCDNVTITPHVAFATRETLDRRIHACIDQLQALLSKAEVSYISR